MNIKLITLLLLVTTVSLIGCSVGTDYQQVAFDTPAEFKHVDGWKVLQSKESALSEQWWVLYQDPILNQLQDQLLADNQTLAQYEARYRQAQALVKNARASYFPTIGMGTETTRSQTGKGNTTLHNYDLGPSVSWEIDLWGKIRRQVESAKADARASEAELAAIKLSLQAELTQTYLQLRIMDIQQQLLSNTTLAYQRSLELTKNQYEAGFVPKSDMMQAKTQLKTTQAQAIDLVYQRAQLEHAIAVLIGLTPAQFNLKADYHIPSLPQLPQLLPSTLLTRRPDIAMAEQQVIAANAQVGVAAAAWYPDLNLKASAGFASNSFNYWINSPNRYWSLGPRFSMTLFDGGLIRSKYEQAEARYDETVAHYRQTVLNSFKEVDDYLVQLQVMQQEIIIQQEAVDSAKETLRLINNQYEAGLIDYLNVASSQSAFLSAQRNYTALLGNQLTASVKLIAAIGGGWNTKHLE